MRDVARSEKERLVKEIADELERRRKAAAWDAFVQRYRGHNDRHSESLRAEQPKKGEGVT